MVLYFMDKKGELTSAQIVTIVLVIAGFVIVLLFLAAFKDIGGGSSDKELCRLSVLERGTADTTLGGKLIKARFPLKCTTEKICITDSKKGECRQFAGEEGVRNVVVNVNKPAEAIKVIEEESANAMYDCWSMMGEGKLDLFGEGIEGITNFKKEESTCVICSRLAIDEKIFEDGTVKGNIIDKVDVSKYLEENNVPGSTSTYLETFTDKGVKSYPSVESYVPDGEDTLEENQNKLRGAAFKKTTDQISFVFMQMAVNDPTEAFATTGKGGFILAGSLLLTPAGKLIATPYGALVTVASIGATAGFSALNAYESGNVAAGYCGDFVKSGKEARKGCSLVKMIDWKVSTVNDLCGQIEGTP